MRTGLALLLLVPFLRAEEQFFPKIGFVEEFPREIRRSKLLILEGNLVRGYKTPELVIMAPNGRTYLNPDNDTTDTDFTFTVRFTDGVGPYKLEIVGHRPTSSRSAARFTVWYGKKKLPDDKYEPPIEKRPPPKTLHDRLIEKRFARWIQQLRRKVRVPAANWNEAIAARAREHAASMATAQRKIHVLNGNGVRELLRRNGAGASRLSGPDTRWTRLSKQRPFPPPNPRLPEHGLFNYVVDDVFGCEDPFAWFQANYLRLPAFRIKAVDPHCTDFAVGAVRYRHPAKDKTGTRRMGRPGSYIYICVVFAQVNDKTLIEGQNEFYRDLLGRAKRTPSPAILRALGNWSRPSAKPHLARYLDDSRAELAGAAHDGMLLLDSRRAARSAQSAKRQITTAGKRRDYGKAAAIHLRYRYSQYDAEARADAGKARRDLEKKALAELGTILSETAPDPGSSPDPAAAKAMAEERGKRLRSLLARTKGLQAQAQVRAAMTP